MQARHLTFSANVFLQEVYLFRGHIELIVPTVFDMQVILVNPAHIQRFHADVLADTVGRMHHIIAGLDIAKMGKFFAFAFLANGTALGMTEDISLRHHHEAGRCQFKTIDKTAHLNVDTICAQLGFGFHHQ